MRYSNRELNLKFKNEEYNVLVWRKKSCKSFILGYSAWRYEEGKKIETPRVNTLQELAKTIDL